MVLAFFYEDRTLYGSVTFIENKFLITAAHYFFDDYPNPTRFAANLAVIKNINHVT